MGQFSDLFRLSGVTPFTSALRASAVRPFSPAALWLLNWQRMKVSLVNDGGAVEVPINGAVGDSF